MLGRRQATAAPPASAACTRPRMWPSAQSISVARHLDTSHCTADSDIHRFVGAAAGVEIPRQQAPPPRSDGRSKEGRPAAAAAGGHQSRSAFSQQQQRTTDTTRGHRHHPESRGGGCLLPVVGRPHRPCGIDGRPAEWVPCAFVRHPSTRPTTAPAHSTSWGPPPDQTPSQPPRQQRRVKLTGAGLVAHFLLLALCTNHFSAFDSVCSLTHFSKPRLLSTPRYSPHRSGHPILVFFRFLRQKMFDDVSHKVKPGNLSFF